MNLLEIEAFIAIVETRNLSKAAEKLFISQSTISNRLNCLEEEVGELLINRRPGIKGITLTAKGTEFLNLANRYMEVEKDIKIWKENLEKYDLKISAPHSINSFLFTELFNRYSNDSGIRLSISTHWNNTIYNLLDNYQLDIGLVSRAFQSRNLVTVPVFYEQLVMVSDKRYSEYSTECTALELVVENEIYLDWGLEFEMWHNQNWSSIRKAKVTVDTPTLIEFFLQSDGAWAVVPLCIANSINKNRNIIISSLVPALPKRTIFLVTQRVGNPSGTEAVKTFIEEMRRFIREQPFIVPHEAIAEKKS